MFGQMLKWFGKILTFIIVRLLSILLMNMFHLLTVRNGISLYLQSLLISKSKMDRYIFHNAILITFSIQFKY
jgi:hypothetical protein